MSRKPKKNPRPYAYPSQPHNRKHGPFGYDTYESYRDWLRDEFSFRCVFCLIRETWGTMRASWHIDHRDPQSANPAGILDYENLLYVCKSCNSAKSSHLVPDPCSIAFGKCLKVRSDGTIIALNSDGEILIDILRLDNNDYTQFRFKILNTVQLKEWLRYPQDLPNLAAQRPRGNTKPDGVKNCHYERRKRGQLPELY